MVEGVGGLSLPQQSKRCVFGLEEVAKPHELEVGSHKQQAALLRISHWSNLGSTGWLTCFPFIFPNVFLAFDVEERTGRGAKSTVFSMHFSQTCTYDRYESTQTSLYTYAQ